jgi:hypothetical protein
LKQLSSKGLLHRVHRAEENGKNNYYGDLTNTEKCVYLQMVRGFYGIPELAGASQSGRRSVFPAFYQAKAKK